VACTACCGHDVCVFYIPDEACRLVSDAISLLALLLQKHLRGTVPFAWGSVA
jgi:hypothetical protein